MPTEAWYVLIVCGAIVVALAIWKGRGIKIRKDSITVDAVRESGPKSAGVSVAAGAKITGSTVGDMTGQVVTGGGAAPSTTPVDVLRNATVSDARIGNVTGRKEDEGQRRPS